VHNPAQGTLLPGWPLLFHRFIVVSLFSFHHHTGRFIVVLFLLHCPCLFFSDPALIFKIYFPGALLPESSIAATSTGRHLQNWAAPLSWLIVISLL